MAYRNCISKMEQALRPQGTAPLVRLFLKRSAYFDKPFIDELLSELRIKTAVDPELSALERLAVHVLLDSSYIELK